MPKLEYDVVFNLDKSSVKSLKDQLDTGTSEQEVKELREEVQRLQQELKNVGGSAGTSGANKQINRLRNNLESLGNSFTGISASSDKMASRVQSNLKNASTSAVPFASSLQNVSRQAGRTNKAFSGANQTVFAFGDLLQDSTQFSQGFAQGMRAIGNNVAFAGELFGQLQQRVRSYNESLSQADIAAGKKKTVVGELKESMSGMTAAVIGANLAFIGFEVASSLVSSALKPLTEQAKATSEAFSEVASSFSDFDTGVEDPFGIRARSREIGILQENIEGLDPNMLMEVSNAAATMGTAGQGLTTLMNFFDVGVEGLFSLRTVLGDVSDETFIQVQANKELRKEVEKLRQTQKAYNNFLDSNPAFKEYVDTTKELERAIVDVRAQTDISENSVRDLFSATKQQISALREKKSLNESEISLLFRLISLRDKAGESLVSQMEAQEKTFELGRKNKQLRLEQQKLLSRNRPKEQARIQAQIRRSKIAQDISSQLQQVEKDLLEGTITAEEAKTRRTRIETQRRLRLKNSEIQKNNELEQQQNKVVAQIVNSSKQLTGAFVRLSNTRAQARINEAKAAGASEERIAELERQAFERRKRAAVAQAIINGAAGIVSAFNPYKPTISEIQAATVAAVTAAQVATIKSQTYSGGGGGVSSGGGGSSEGFTTTDVSGNRGSGVDSSVANQANRSPQTEIVIEANNVLPDTEFSKRAENGRKQRERKSKIMRRD